MRILFLLVKKKKCYKPRTWALLLHTRQKSVNYSPCIPPIIATLALFELKIDHQRTTVVLVASPKTYIGKFLLVSLAIFFFFYSVMNILIKLLYFSETPRNQSSGNQQEVLQFMY